MKQLTRTRGFAIAAAAAALFAAAPMAACAAEQSNQKGHCMGANACKGQSACKTANNACSGQNACKGQGYIEATKEECAKKGGRFMTGEAHEGMDKPKDQSKPKS
jgi:hypothetical protein